MLLIKFENKSFDRFLTCLSRNKILADDASFVFTWLAIFLYTLAHIVLGNYNITTQEIPRPPCVTGVMDLFLYVFFSFLPPAPTTGEFKKVNFQMSLHFVGYLFTNQTGSVLIRLDNQVLIGNIRVFTQKYILYLTYLSRLFQMLSF